jgi:hypothetical protein
MIFGSICTYGEVGVSVSVTTILVTSPVDETEAVVLNAGSEVGKLAVEETPVDSEIAVELVEDTPSSLVPDG